MKWLLFWKLLSMNSVSMRSLCIVLISRAFLFYLVLIDFAFLPTAWHTLGSHLGPGVYLKVATSDALSCQTPLFFNIFIAFLYSDKNNTQNSIILSSSNILSFDRNVYRFTSFLSVSNANALQVSISAHKLIANRQYSYFHLHATFHKWQCANHLIKANIQ